MRTGIGFALCAGLLSACTTAPKEPRVEYHTAKVAVAAPCVKDRPERPQALRERISDDQWAVKPPGAKARAVEAQAGIRLNYEDSFAASVAGCRDIER